MAAAQVTGHPARIVGRPYNRPRDAVRPRGVQRRGSRHPAPLLHQPRRAGVRPRQPARGRQGRAVRPLQPQPEEPAPAVPRRVRRRPRHLRRPRHRRHRRPRARRGALREGVLRVRRRLGRPARRRAPGLRAGVEHPHQGARVGRADELPRAEHPLHRLRRPPRRALPLLPRPRRDGQPASAPATSARWTACSTPTGALLAAVTDHVRATVAKDPADTDFVFRQATRAKALDATRGMLPAASLSNVGIYGTGRRSRRCCCACAPTRCPRPGPTPS